jgi:hypothetical protein
LWLRPYLDAKELKPLAGLEELRTDVSSVLACLNDVRLPACEAQLTYEFILAERLLRYAVEGIPRPKYDAVASQVLFNYLLKNRGISLHNERIRLRSDLPAVLDNFLQEIHSIERQIHSTSVAEVRADLPEFTNCYTEYDEEARDYRHIPFFAAVKMGLAVWGIGMKDAVSHYIPPPSPLTSTTLQAFSNNLTMPFPDRAAGLLQGLLAATRTGLSPAGDDELPIRA